VGETIDQGLLLVLVKILGGELVLTKESFDERLEARTYLGKPRAGGLQCVRFLAKPLRLGLDAIEYFVS